MSEPLNLGIRDEYRPTFGRQVLTLWSGPFFSVYWGVAVQLPNGDGYMITLEHGGKARVTCPSPRTEDNWQEVDAALKAAGKTIIEQTTVPLIAEPKAGKTFTLTDADLADIKEALDDVYAYAVGDNDPNDADFEESDRARIALAERLAALFGVKISF